MGFAFIQTARPILATISRNMFSFATSKFACPSNRRFGIFLGRSQCKFRLSSSTCIFSLHSNYAFIGNRNAFYIISAIFRESIASIAIRCTSCFNRI